MSRPDTYVTMFNPDRRDSTTTQRLIDRLGLPNVRVEAKTAAEIGDTSQYDCVWAISVVEHFAGERGDIDGMVSMYRALAPGGRLIVTVPVDRAYRMEYRDHDEYGLDTEAESTRGHFFQRYYDEVAIRERLVRATGRPATITRWFGERTPGRFLAYERDWQRRGHRCTVWDPLEVGREYQEYSSWASMPGIGICGFMVEKPMEQHET